ncbi:hypothetical protein PC129_g11008 [Phytophthora cactorum]|uniref:Uncharacterized protein n=1 Tax=Phytophthora cactorum TaxID=29920 RepID=A0A329S4M4_9STRA|nr:hypothetical protein Pcac1_g5447 [Phytophthora cactorum]KAG2818930.1 hypothetical protein PC111_g12086 [Phytophthora cactorum]KAG2835261.1 hypothetical protein PC112_g5747 [Phytophthora cactorum]KAG2863501.1 hypothetical protein PC113_g5393 [Phytophthora cactorum]KAG2902501.1 hypothetical protein PC114_g12721 [Phytophthora cactorum]
MVFAVNFSTRPLDHFLLPPAQSGGRLSVTHDSATWGTGDTVPTEHILFSGDLRLALSRIHEAVIEWYPRLVAEVFGMVHADSLAEALDHAPQDLVHATIDFYTYVFPLRPDLYRVHLASDPELPLLCSIAEQGIVPHWIQQAAKGFARFLTTTQVLWTGQA